MLIGMGPIIGEAIKASNILKKEGISLGVASMSSVKPLDHRFLMECVNNGYSQLITLEEHHKSGGLGTAVLEWMNEYKINGTQLLRLGIEDHFIHKLGSQSYVRGCEELNSEAIANKVRGLIQ